MKKFRYRGGPSEILEPIEFEGFAIRTLIHGNTKQQLYYAPRVEDLELQWTMNLDTAKKGVRCYNEIAKETEQAKKG